MAAIPNSHWNVLLVDGTPSEDGCGPISPSSPPPAQPPALQVLDTNCAEYRVHVRDHHAHDLRECEAIYGSNTRTWTKFSLQRQPLVPDSSRSRIASKRVSKAATRRSTPPSAGVRKFDLHGIRQHRRPRDCKPFRCYRNRMGHALNGIDRDPMVGTAQTCVTGTSRAAFAHRSASRYHGFCGVDNQLNQVTFTGRPPCSVRAVNSHVCVSSLTFEVRYRRFRRHRPRIQSLRAVLRRLCLQSTTSSRARISAPVVSAIAVGSFAAAAAAVPT